MGKFTKYKWRLYADKQIEREIVEHLRASDIDVLWIAEHPELERQQDDEFHYRKARELGRYLLTKDMDFWDDRKHPLKGSPGTVIIATGDASVAKHLPVLLRELMHAYNPLSEPVYLDGMKIKLSSEGITLRFVDPETQMVITENWTWADLL
jgi:predicted nuclease of predicted toxin-antitoxin system